MVAADLNQEVKMTSREPGDFSTPTPEQLQAWFDLPSEPAQQESAESFEPSRSDSYDRFSIDGVRRVNKALAALDLLWNAACEGSEDALEHFAAVENELLTFASETREKGYSSWGAYR
jgi:hypothetical protein